MNSTVKYYNFSALYPFTVSIISVFIQLYDELGIKPLYNGSEYAKTMY